MLLFVAAHGILNRSTDASLLGELLANDAVLGEWSSDLLSSSADGSLGC